MHMQGLGELIGFSAGISAYICGVHWGFPLLQVPQEPIISMIITKTISVVFAGLSAIVAYLAVHYTKKFLKHEK